MISINGIPVTVDHFPDGTQHINIGNYVSWFRPSQMDIPITWNYEKDEELLTLIYLTDYIRSKYKYSDICNILLYMPYVPNARMDRVENEHDVFTLKSFCNIINSLNFYSVRVTDAHSDVAIALLNNVTVDTHKDIFEGCMEISNNTLLYYPDNGAAKKYEKQYKHPYCCGVKHRDWQTGTITGLEIQANDNVIEGKDIIMIDDICSKGTTFVKSAEALKKLGAKDITLYVTHCEPTIFQGEVLTSGLIKHVYTTNSLKRTPHDMITEVNL